MMTLALRGKNNELRDKATALLTLMRQARGRLRDACQFYTEIPLWSYEPPEKLPLNEWKYVQDGKVGIYFIGNTVYSTVCLLKADGDLPANWDGIRSRIIHVRSGFVIDRVSGKRYDSGESFSVLPGDTISIAVHGLIKISWVPSIPIQFSSKL